MCIGCEKENVAPISNEANKQVLLLAVKDAKNPSLSIAGLQVRIEGESLERGTLYADGKELKAGILSVSNQAAILTCKSAGLKHISFTVWASAPGYVSNFRHVKVTNLDSLQFVDIALVKIADAPEDVNVENNLLFYSNASLHVPGGLYSVHTNLGEKTFLLGSAVQSSSINNLLVFELQIGEDTHNPETGLVIQNGDPIEIWFLPENASRWEKLQGQKIRTDSKGRKYVSTTLEKAGTILAGYGLDPCIEPLLITLEKPCLQDQMLCVRLLQGNKQVLAERRIAAKSHGPYTLYLPKNLDYTLSLHNGSTMMSNKVYQNDLPNCAFLALIKYSHD